MDHLPTNKQNTNPCPRNSLLSPRIPPQPFQSTPPRKDCPSFCRRPKASQRLPGSKRRWNPTIPVVPGLRWGSLPNVLASVPDPVVWTANQPLHSMHLGCAASRRAGWHSAPVSGPSPLPPVHRGGLGTTLLHHCQRHHAVAPEKDRVLAQYVVPLPDGHEHRPTFQGSLRSASP